MAYVHMHWNWKQGPNKSLQSELVFMGETHYPHQMTGMMDNESAVCQNAGHRVSCSECKGNGKAVLLQAWSGPEASRKLRFPDFMTTAQDGGKVVSLT
jgi:hypothetical protein